MKLDRDPLSFGPAWSFTWRDACIALLIILAIVLFVWNTHWSLPDPADYALPVIVEALRT